MTPQQLHWLFSAKLILTIVLGGSRHFLGPVLGAFAFVALQDIALPYVEYRDLVLGAMLIAVVFVFPGGIAGSATVLLNHMRRLAKHRRLNWFTNE